MYHNGFSDDLSDRESVRHEGHPSPALISEKRRHISGMARMRAALRIIMALRIRKRCLGCPAAVAARMYVKTENTFKYREIDTLTKDDKYAIVRFDNTKSNSLLLYDEIIVK